MDGFADRGGRRIVHLLDDLNRERKRYGVMKKETKDMARWTYKEAGHLIILIIIYTLTFSLYK